MQPGTDRDEAAAATPVRRSLDVIVDVHHVNAHVPSQLLGLRRKLSVTVRLLVTGAVDGRPVVVLPRTTDLDVAAAGMTVRRHPHRSAAFTVYDEERLEVPLWRVTASGWSEEPGEVAAAGRLFDLLWQEAVPWPDGADVRGQPHQPLWHWPPAGPAPAALGSPT